MQKATLGPLGARVCRQCGEAVTIGWGPNLLVVLPLLAAMIWLLVSLEGWARLASLLAVAGLATIIQLLWIPLEKK